MFQANVIIIEKRDVPLSRQYDNLLLRNERDMRLGLQRWFADTIKQVQQDLVGQFAKKKDITTYLTDWKRIEDNGKVVLKPVALEVTRKGGQFAYKSLGITDKFDVTNPRAVANVNKHCAHLVREVTVETKRGIRTFIRNGINEGKGMPKIARELRPIVGLTKNQVQSVANYERMLKATDLPADKIKRKVRRYRDKTHRRRMQTIARTETARAQNFGYVQGLEDTGINKVEFLIAADACPVCVDLDGERYPLEEAEAVIPIHPNCRCTMLPVINDRKISRPLVSAPPDLPGVMAPVKDLQPWRQYLASHRGGEKNYSAVLYDWYKLNYQATSKLSPSAHKFLLKNAKRFETASVKIRTKIPGLPKPPPIKLVAEGSGSNIGNVGVLKELPPELASGKKGADALTFTKDGKKYFAKRMRSDEIIQFQREATAARALEKVGLGEYTPRVYLAEGTYEGKRLRVIASEMIEKHRDLSALELSDKYRILNTISDEVKERLVLQDYLMSAWDRSASNMMVKKGSIKMLDYELAFSDKAPVWSNHSLMQFLGKKVKVPAPDGKFFMLRVHEGKISQYKFNKKVLQDTVDSAKKISIAIDEMNIPNDLKILWKVNVDKRAKELVKMAERMNLVIEPAPSLVRPIAVKPPMKPKPRPLKPIPKPKPLTPVEPKPGVLPKSYYDEAPGGWDKRLAAHKTDLRKRFDFDLETLKVGRTDLPEFKAAAAKFESALKSYTKPATNLTQAKKNLHFTNLTGGDTKKLSKAPNRQVTKALEMFEEIGCDDLMSSYNQAPISVNMKTAQSMGNYAGYAEAENFSIFVTPSTHSSTYFHEMGHLLETNYNARRKAQRWVAARGKHVRMRWGDIRPSAGPGHAELSGYKDKFIDSYVGKIYNTGETEAISTGLGQFTNYNSMLRFAKKDFDHFAFIHGILTGAI